MIRISTKLRSKLIFLLLKYKNYKSYSSRMSFVRTRHNLIPSPSVHHRVIATCSPAVLLFVHTSQFPAIFTTSRRDGSICHLADKSPTTARNIGSHLFNCDSTLSPSCLTKYIPSGSQLRSSSLSLSYILFRLFHGETLSFTL